MPPMSKKRSACQSACFHPSLTTSANFRDFRDVTIFQFEIAKFDLKTLKYYNLTRYIEWAKLNLGKKLVALLPTRVTWNFRPATWDIFDQNPSTVVSDAMDKHPAGEESDGRAEAPRFDFPQSWNPHIKIAGWEVQNVQIWVCLKTENSVYSQL